jgi:hypothetical protein
LQRSRFLPAIARSRSRLRYSLVSDRGDTML